MVAVTLPPMPWRILVVCTLLGVASGAIWGFIRGLYNLPTVPFAVIEGGILFGVPAVLVGLLLTGAWALGRAVRHHAA